MALSAHLDCRPDAEEDEEETEHHQDDHPSQAEVVLSWDRVGLDGGVAEPPANLGVVDPLDKVDPGPGGRVEVVASGEQVIHQQGLKHYCRDVAGPH